MGIEGLVPEAPKEATVESKVAPTVAPTVAPKAVPAAPASEDTMTKFRRVMLEFQGYDTEMSDALHRLLHKNGVHFTS